MRLRTDRIREIGTRPEGNMKKDYRTCRTEQEARRLWMEAILKVPKDTELDILVKLETGELRVKINGPVPVLKVFMWRKL